PPTGRCSSTTTSTASTTARSPRSASSRPCSRWMLATPERQPGSEGAPAGLRRVVGTVAALNLGYFGIEFAVALAIGSVSLFADSIDFLEDASLNLLILIALSWSARNRARLGFGLAGLLLAPGL